MLAFDYRGIGESRPSRLRGFVAGFEDWAEYDAGGAIAWMAARYPGARLTGMGHSIGSLLIGAAGGADSLTQVVLICPHTGYHNDYSWSLRLAVRLCWRVIGPTLRATLGYFPSSKLGFGEDLPSRIALQWAARSQSAFAIGLQNGDKDRETRILEHAKSLCVPALVISVEDDAWATEAGVRRLLHVYRNLTIIRRSIASTVRKGRPLGHSGFFRRSQRELHWKQVVRFMHGGTNNASIRTQAKAEAQ